MHDLMFTKEILTALDDKLKTLSKGSKIVSVNASLSPLSHVKPETLTETFKAMTKGTEFDKVALKVNILQLKIICRACKQSFMIDKPVTGCVNCGDSDLDIVFNKEFAVNSIETKNR